VLAEAAVPAYFNGMNVWAETINTEGPTIPVSREEVPWTPCHRLLQSCTTW